MTSAWIYILRNFFFVGRVLKSLSKISISTGITLLDTIKRYELEELLFSKKTTTILVKIMNQNLAPIIKMDQTTFFVLIAQDCSFLFTALEHKI